ncbi:MAG: 4Fe-4S binding protein, partial [Pseudomonadota bacterium]|nr:4Fe-4S binding protein [Pseudomonadota bacterium]
MPLKTRIFLVILVLGAYSQIVQAVLIREGLVVFYGNEVSLGAFYASWLFWLAVGSVAVVRSSHRHWVLDALASVRRLLLWLPGLLLLQVSSLRMVRMFLDVSSSEFVPLGDLFLSLFLVTIPSALLLGVAFPLACKALREQVGHQSGDGGTGVAVSVVSRLYVADALGALGGGVFFTFVLIQWFGLVQTLGLLTLLLGLSAWSLRGGPVSRGWGALILGAAGLAVAVTPVASWMEIELEKLRFATLQPGLELLDTVETRYGHVAVARLGEQISVVGDGQIRDSFPLPREVEREAAYFYSQAAGAKRVLLFGGFPGGLPAEFLRYPVEHVHVVEEDRRAFERVRPFLTPESTAAFEDPRLGLHFQDGRRFVNRLSPDARYDLVLVLNASPSSAYSNRYFTRDFYAQVAAHLAPDGVFCTQVSGASNFLGRTVGSYTGSIYRTLQEIFPHIAIAPGDVQVFCASPSPDQVTEEPYELERRYLATPLEEHRFPAASFYALLPTENIAYVRDRFVQAKAEVNRDERPVTYYLNMVLWGKFSASAFVDWLERMRGMGAWPYLLPPILFVLLWLLRAGMEGFRRPALQRRSATFVLVVLGLIAMAAQLVLLFSYQSHVGFMFERVALLNGLFMTGLALGAGVGRWLARGTRPVAALALVMVLVTAGLLILPGALSALGTETSVWQETGYLSLALTVGLLTGTGFPLGVRLAHQDLGEIVQSGGITQAADNLGGALGGLITGALMVPLLGVATACGVLAVLALVSLVPLLFARLAPESIAGLNERGFQSFPWLGLGWLLLFAVSLVYGWHLLERGAEPGPRVQFDESRLAEVSGSARFELAEAPFAHYQGFAAGAQEAETAALATMAAAPEVKGFAGPINLLLAVDRGGVLRGVRYVDSNETPSYIAGIDQWLGGLAGADLAAGPLSLDRVDALSGATLSSQAALEAINRSSRRATEIVFDNPLPEPEEGRPGGLDLGFYVTLLLLLAFFPAYLSGSERARLAFQVTSLALLGLWLNTLVTEVDLVNLSLGHAASLAQNPQRWLLLGFVGLTAVLFGQVWCGYLCPFGALQELVSRLGRLLGLRTYPDRRWDQRARYLKFLLLAAMLIGAWVSGEGIWASFDPMQHAFGGSLMGWMLILLIAVLLGSLFYVR